MSAITTYRSIIPTFKDLPAEDFKKLVLAYWEYSFNGVEPENLNVYQKAIFESLRANIDISNTRRIKAAERKRASREKFKNEQRATQKSVTSCDVTRCHVTSRTNENENENVNENVNVNVNENENENENVNENENGKLLYSYIDRGCGGKTHTQKEKTTTFTPPTLEQVKEYCEERNNGIDAETFINFYTSKGWYIGKNKMKDWKAAVRTWERKERGGGSYTDKINNRISVVDSWLTDQGAT